MSYISPSWRLFRWDRIEKNKLYCPAEAGKLSLFSSRVRCWLATIYVTCSVKTLTFDMCRASGQFLFPPAESIISQQISYCNKLAWCRGIFSRTVGWTLVRYESKFMCLMLLYLHNCQWEQTKLFTGINDLFLHCIYRSVKNLHLCLLVHLIFVKY